jgi:hypothetical protein
VTEVAVGLPLPDREALNHTSWVNGLDLERVAHPPGLEKKRAAVTAPPKGSVRPKNDCDTMARTGARGRKPQPYNKCSCRRLRDNKRNCRSGHRCEEFHALLRPQATTAVAGPNGPHPATVGAATSSFPRAGC